MNIQRFIEKRKARGLSQSELAKGFVRKLRLVALKRMVKSQL